MARRKQPFTHEDRAYFVGTILGIVVGAIFALSGLVIVILGFNGNIQWIVQAGSFSSKLANAGPGVFFALLGMFILWRYKPKTFSHQMRDERLGRTWDLGIREMKSMPYREGHIKELMKIFEANVEGIEKIIPKDSSSSQPPESSGSSSLPTSTSQSMPPSQDTPPKE